MNYPLVRLGEIATSIQYGLTASGSREPVGPRFLRITDIDDFGGLSDAEAVFVESDEAAIEKYAVRVGDLLIARSGATAGRAYVVKHDAVGWVFASYIIRFTLNHEIIDPDFLQQFCLSPFYKFQIERIARGAAQPNVNSKELARLKIPLPPLSEQRRIVEILNEGRDIRRFRQQADDLTTQLIPAVFNEMFSGPNGYAHLPEVAIRKVVESAEYGTSKVANEDGVGVPVLRMNNVTYEGELDLSDVKHVAMSDSELKKQLLRENDVLFNRTNSLELVGKTGLWDGQIEAVAASYFVRVRLDLERVDPRFFVAFLNLASTKRRLQNMAKQAIGMSNINATELQRIRMPLPDIGLQRQFGDRVAAIREYKHSVADSVVGEERLTQSLLAHAFSGELTADWRDANRQQLAKEADERDQWLSENGVKLTTADHGRQGTTDPTDGLAWELNNDQKALLEQIQKLDRNENGGLFTLSSLQLSAPLDALPRDAVRRHLDVLTARGLVLSVSRRFGTSESVTFGNVYRLPLREEDFTGTGDQSDLARMSEMERLSRQGREIRTTASGSLNLTGTAEASVSHSEGDD